MYLWHIAQRLLDVINVILLTCRSLPLILLALLEIMRMPLTLILIALLERFRKVEGAGFEPTHLWDIAQRLFNVVNVIKLKDEGLWH